MPEVQAQLGKAVRAARKARGWSQEELAAAADVDRTYISGLERGTRNPAISTVERIARALGVPLRELLRDENGGGR